MSNLNGLSVMKIRLPERETTNGGGAGAGVSADGTGCTVTFSAAAGTLSSGFVVDEGTAFVFSSLRPGVGVGVGVGRMAGRTRLSFGSNCAASSAEASSITKNALGTPARAGQVANTSRELARVSALVFRNLTRVLNSLVGLPTS